MKVVVIDYGAGNLGSVTRCLQNCGAQVQVSSDPAIVASADALILPGVGAFADGMNGLNERGLTPAVREAASQRKVPFLGFCLGMQLLADKGNEFSLMTPGLGLIPGEVTRLVPRGNERIPHIGWNSVHKTKDSFLLSGIADDTDFYFAHSFHFIPARPEDTVATTPFCGGFSSVIGRENIWGTQCHPEKSSQGGRQLIKNFLEYAASC